MQADVTVLGSGKESISPEFKQQVKRRSLAAGLKEADVHAASGDLVQQVAINAPVPCSSS